jgi:hypothetical protein
VLARLDRVNAADVKGLLARAVEQQQAGKRKRVSSPP